VDISEISPSLEKSPTGKYDKIIGDGRIIRVPNEYLDEVKAQEKKSILVTLDDEFLDVK
jgi:hypothetical protein